MNFMSLGRVILMRFSLNLVELYNNMANEYDEPISEYMCYEVFVEYIKRYGLRILESATGDYIVLDVFDLEEVDSDGQI